MGRRKVRITTFETVDLEGAEEGADGDEGGGDGGYSWLDERPYHGWGSGV